MDLCRTCGQQRFLETLCNIKDPELMVEDKLQRTFNVKLMPDKILPQQICFQCITKLESSLEFCQKVKETQAKLRNSLASQNSVHDFNPANIKVEIIENDFDDGSLPMIQPTTSRAVKQEFKAPSQKTQPMKRIRIARPKSVNPPGTRREETLIKVCDVFANELKGNFDGPTDMLDIDEDYKNPDGSLTENGALGIHGWDHYEWKCVICSSGDEKFLLESSQSLEQHFRLKHKDAKLCYPCMDCKLSFKSYFSFQNHVIEHQPHMKFSCDVCNVYRWNLVDLYKHRQEFHPKFKNTCLYCGRIYETGHHLKQHAGVHQKWKTKEHFYCDLCPYEAHTKFLMKQHINYSHAKINLFESVCDQCGKVCKRPSDMRSHMLVHSNERPHGCELCHLKFKCPKQLKKHISTHFLSSLTLECEVCHKKFPTKSKLTRHFRVHTDECQFECEFCGRKFKHASGFNTHRRIHTGERPYVCTFENCGQKFIDWPNMNKHCKAKHSIDNATKKQKLYLDKAPPGILL